VHDLEGDGVAGEQPRFFGSLFKLPIASMASFPVPPVDVYSIDKRVSEIENFFIEIARRLRAVGYGRPM